MVQSNVQEIILGYTEKISIVNPNIINPYITSQCLILFFIIYRVSSTFGSFCLFLVFISVLLVFFNEDSILSIRHVAHRHSSGCSSYSLIFNQPSLFIIFRLWGGAWVTFDWPVLSIVPIPFACTVASTTNLLFSRIWSTPKVLVLILHIQLIFLRYVYGLFQWLLQSGPNHSIENGTVSLHYLHEIKVNYLA